MNDLRNAAQQALTEMANARDYIWLLEDGGTGISEKEILNKIANVITSLRAALTEPVQKPLTEEKIHDCFQQRHKDKATERRMITRAIERAHGIGDA